MPDCDVIISVSLLHPTQLIPDKKANNSTKKAVCSGTHIATKVIPPPASLKSVSGSEADESLSQDGTETSQDGTEASQDANALEQARRLKVGLFRMKLFDFASTRSEYGGGNEGGQTKIGNNSKIYYLPKKTSNDVSEFPNDTITMWDVLNKMRQPSDSSVSISLSIGDKQPDDEHYIQIQLRVYY